MKIRPTIKYLFVSVLILFLSCEEEQIVDTQEQQSLTQTTPVQIFQSAFDLDKFEDPAEQIVDNIEIDWNDFTIKTIENIEWYEFQVNENKPVGYEDGIIKGYNYTLLAALVDKGDPKLYLNKMLSYSDGRANSYLDIKNEYFHGLVYLYTMTGHTDYLQHYQKGLLISQFEDNEVKPTDISPLTNRSDDCMNKTSLTARCDSALQCALDGGNNSGSCGGGNGGGSPTGGGYRTVTTYHYTDWYNVRTNGTKEYSNTQYHGSTREYVWVPSNHRGAMTTWNYSTHEQNGRMTHTRQRPRNAVERPKLLLADKTLKKSPCLNGIFLDLGRGGYYNDPIKPEIQLPSNRLNMSFSAAVQQLFNESTKFNYVIKVGTLNGVTASTNYTSKIITTEVSRSYLQNATRLSIARTMIHESTHAFLVYKLKSNAEFSVLLNSFAKQNGYTSLNRVHHEFMIQYVNAIAHSLFKWDLNHGSGKDLGWDYYYSMAFGGLLYDKNGKLKEVDAFKALIPKRKDRKKILLIIENEQNGNKNAKGKKC